MRLSNTVVAVALLVGVLMIFVVLPLALSLAPVRWCEATLPPMACYREWLGSLAGWAALVAAALALTISRQQHRVAVRVANANLISDLNELIRRVDRWVEQAGRPSLPRTADFDAEFMMSSAELKRLDAIATFTAVRKLALIETRKWQGQNKQAEVLDAQKQLLATMLQIRGMLEHGLDVPEIATRLSS